MSEKMPAVILETDGYETRLAEELAARRERRLAANIRSYRPRTNNASAISTCALQMWYARMRPEDKTLWDTWVQASVEDGRHEETKVVRELMEDGWEVEAGQAQVDITDGGGRVILTGKIDGKIRWEGHLVPFEEKRLPQNVFAAVQERGVSALMDRPWTRRYVYQITTYLYQHDEPRGIFIGSDGRGHLLFVPISLDLATMESILQMCERVEDAVEAETPPAPLPTYDPGTCGKCGWQQICLVQRSSDAAEIVADGELVEVLEAREASAAVHREYEAADRRAKALLRERANVLVAGKWMVTGEWRERAVKEQTARVDRYWLTKIEALAPREDRFGGTEGWWAG